MLAPRSTGRPSCGSKRSRIFGREPGQDSHNSTYVSTRSSFPTRPAFDNNRWAFPLEESFATSRFRRPLSQESRSRLSCNEFHVVFFGTRTFYATLREPRVRIPSMAGHEPDTAIANLSLVTLAIILGIISATGSGGERLPCRSFPGSGGLGDRRYRRRLDNSVPWGTGRCTRSRGHPRESIPMSLRFTRCRLCPTVRQSRSDTLAAFEFAASRLSPYQLPETGVHVESIEEVGGLLWLKTHSDLKVYQLDGLVTRDIGSPKSVQKMFSALGSVWLTTTNDVYRVDSGVCQKVVEHIDFFSRPEGRETIAGRLWLFAGNGVWVIGPSGTMRIFQGTVRAHQQIGSRLVLDTDSGTKLIEQPDASTPIVEDLPLLKLDLDQTTRSYAQLSVSVGGKPFQTVDLSRDDPIPGLGMSLRSFIALQGRISGDGFFIDLLGSDDAGFLLNYGRFLYRLTSTHLELLSDAFPALASLKLRQIRGKTWAVTQYSGMDALLIGSSGTTDFLPSVGRSVMSRLNDAVDFDGATWLLTSVGAYRIKGQESRRIPDSVIDAKQILAFKGHTRLIAADALWTVDGDSAVLTQKFDGDVHQVEEHFGYLCLSTRAGFWIFDGAEAKRVPNAALEVNRLYEADGRLLVATRAGLFRIYPGASIHASLRPLNSVFLGFPGNLLPGSFGFTGVARVQAAYEGPVPKDYLAAAGGAFEVVVDGNDRQFSSFIDRGWYTGIESIQRSLDTAGRHTIRISIRDKWRNTFVSEARVWVVPGFPASVFMGYALVFMLALALIWNSPRFSFAHNVVMSPTLRKMPSLYAIPVILTLAPGLVKRLLVRYRSRLQAATQSAADDFMLPEPQLAASVMKETIHAKRSLFVVGPSGIGKSAYMVYLANSFAAGSALPEFVVVILVQLRQYVDIRPADVFQAELVNYGGFRDPELADDVLRLGGVLFLLDGLNEVTEKTVQQWSAFYQAHSAQNYFIIASQFVDAGFPALPVCEIPPLTDETARKLLARELGVEPAKLPSLPKPTLLLARIPQNLKAITQILRAGAPAPQSEYELYEQLLTPLFDRWRHEGKSDRIEELCAAAVSDTDDPQARAVDSLSADVLYALVNEKLIVIRGAQKAFAHEHVRAYLAAYAVIKDWPAVLGMDLRFPQSWILPLRFALPSLAREDDIKIAEALLQKKTDSSLLRGEELAAGILARFGEAAVGDWFRRYAVKLVAARQKIDSALIGTGAPDATAH